jgi:hypothetical protein
MQHTRPCICRACAYLLPYSWRHTGGVPYHEKHSTPQHASRRSDQIRSARVQAYAFDVPRHDAGHSLVQMQGNMFSLTPCHVVHWMQTKKSGISNDWQRKKNGGLRGSRVRSKTWRFLFHFGWMEGAFDDLDKISENRVGRNRGEFKLQCTYTSTTYFLYLCLQLDLFLTTSGNLMNATSTYRMNCGINFAFV